MAAKCGWPFHICETLKCVLWLVLLSVLFEMSRKFNVAQNCNPNPCITQFGQAKPENENIELKHAKKQQQQQK